MVMFLYLKKVFKLRNTKIKYVGVEIDPWKIDFLKTNFKDVNLITRDIRFYKLKSNYDLIICSEVLEHIEKQYLQNLVNQMAEKSKYTILSVPQPTYKRNNPWHINEMLTDDLMKVVKLAGFKVLFKGWFYTKFSSKEEGEFMPSIIAKFYHGLKKTYPKEGNVTFLVLKGKYE